MAPISSLLLGLGFHLEGAVLYGGVHTRWLHWGHALTQYVCHVCNREF